MQHVGKNKRRAAFRAARLRAQRARTSLPGRRVKSMRCGHWNDPGVWSYGVPEAGQRVLIRAGHVVTVPAGAGFGLDERLR